MKNPLLLLPFLALSALACNPFFPPSYISDMGDRYFKENINIPAELMLLARQYELIDSTVFPTSTLSTVEADLLDFSQRANELGMPDLLPTYTAYANALRTARPSDEEPLQLPEILREFTLYLDGVKESKSDPGLTDPPSWITLLDLPKEYRSNRTTWVHYMLGNLAASHGQPAAASKHYTACRQAARDGMNDSLGLAGASYKREFLAQTNTADRIRSGVQAIGYYQQSGETAKRTHCLQYFDRDFSETTSLTAAHLETPLGLEVSALYYSRSNDPRSDAVSEQLKKSPPLQTAPRLAWFLYKRGETDRASDFLETCPEDDPLANWLRFRIAQRSGDTDTAIAYLRCWLDEIQHSDRIFFSFIDTYKIRADTCGILGSLLVTRGDMQDALAAFVQAGSYADAALIAERYLETDTLKPIVDAFALQPVQTHSRRVYYRRDDVKDPQEIVKQDLSYLLARRLFREDRIREALPYYPEDIAELVRKYLTACDQSANRSLSRNERSAHMFHAARILRWKGMEMRGTAHAPDYTIVKGNYNFGGVPEEDFSEIPDLADLYTETAPAPDVRFHYRYLAAELAGQAAELAKNRHQRAAILWCTGEWLQNRDPKAADLFYKQLARIRFQALAKAADKNRWFPRPSGALNKIYRSEQYISPANLSAAAQQYAGPAE